MGASRLRAAGSALCATFGILCIFAAVLLGYAARSLFDERGFSERVAASLEDPGVATFVAERLTDAVIRAEPNLIGLRPMLIGVGRSVVSSPPFRAAARRSARAIHHSIFTGSGEKIVLTIQDLGDVLQSALASRPELAKKIPAGVSAAIGRIDALPGGALSTKLVRLGHRARNWTIALLLAGILLCMACVRLSGQRRLAIVRLGLALIALAVVLAIVGRFGGDLLSMLAKPHTLGPALAGLAGAFLGGLLVWAAGLGFGGLVLAAASASLLERVPMQLLAERSRSWFTESQQRMSVRAARGLLGAGVGAALLFWTIPSLTVLGWLAGAVIAFAGLREVFLAALHVLPEIEKRPDGERAVARASSRRRVVLVGSLAALLLGGTIGWLARPNPTSNASEPDALACNGSPDLCDRRLDQVVFPATHNSMGGADNAGWMFPNQTAGIERQLADGVRAFLIDLHYGFPVGNTIKTDLTNEHHSMETYEGALGKEGMDAALRIRDRLARGKEGPRDVYLCHGFCELGAIRFTDALRAVRSFMVANPGEVLILDIQDESVAPADVARCFETSGLISFVYRGPVSAPWPTLREMVESDQRIVVTAENNSAGVPWYHASFEVMQETPYTFRDTTEFSNRPNRGGTTGSLMLMNHWIESTPSPKPTNAEIVNAHDFLMRRVRAFQRERGRVPNLIAVDFYGIGDLFRVCRELNEESPPPSGPP